jgi:hypothetical protein
MRRVVLSRLADAEVTEASEWYDLQALNLGLEFLDQFKKDAQAIAEGPLRWPVFGGERAAICDDSISLFDLLRS